MKILYFKQKLVFLLFITVYFILWVQINFEIIYALLYPDLKPKGIFPIVLLIIITISQYLYEIWNCVYISQINWKTTLFTVIFIAILGVFEGIIRPYFPFLRKVILLLFLNTLFLIYFLFERKRFKKLKRIFFKKINSP